MTTNVFEPQELQQNNINVFEPQEVSKTSSLTLEQIMTEIKYRGTKEDFANIKTNFYYETAKIERDHNLSVRYVVTLVLIAMGVVFTVLALFLKFSPTNISPFY